MGGHVLSTVLDAQLVSLDDGLHRADVGERRENNYLTLGVVVLVFLQLYSQALD